MTWLSRPRPRFVGAVDGIIGNQLRGWVVDRRALQERVVVCFGSDRTLGLQIVADVYRSDVQKVGLSEDGYCGFCIPLAALAASTSIIFIRLSASHHIQRAPVDEPASALRLIRHGPMLYSAQRRNGWVSGFALDLDDPSRRPRLNLTVADGGVRLCVACRFDERARITPEYDGFHGFRLPAAPQPARLTDDATGVLVAAWKR